MRKGWGDRTAWGMRLGLPRSQRGDLQGSGMQSPPAPRAAQAPLLPVAYVPWGAEAQPAPETPQRSRKGVSAKTGLVLLLLTKRQVRGTKRLESQLFLRIYPIAACTGKQQAPRKAKHSRLL